jgi:hypothetical protein
MAQADRDRTTFAAYRLLSGRRHISPELVAENQRWQLLGARIVYGDTHRSDLFVTKSLETSLS